MNTEILNLLLDMISSKYNFLIGILNMVFSNGTLVTVNNKTVINNETVVKKKFKNKKDRKKKGKKKSRIKKINKKK